MKARMMSFGKRSVGGTINSLFIGAFLFFLGCASSDPMVGKWDYEVRGEDELSGVIEIGKSGDSYQVEINAEELGKIDLENVQFQSGKLTGTFEAWDEEFKVEFSFEEGSFTGAFNMEDEVFRVSGYKQSNEPVIIDRSNVTYLLEESALNPIENDIDHAGLIGELDRDSYYRGARIYNSNCINCHGNPELEGSIPMSAKFWDGPLKGGNDHYSLYLTLTRGLGSMPPQVILTPQEKYDVIHYVRKEYLTDNDQIEFVRATDGYLSNLPEGSSKGPEPKPYNPWSDMDYGNFFINTYELVDEETGPERFHSPGPTPFVDEDYLANNFAYKGIAVRLDAGDGGISKGKSWMIFDHDVMRVAGGWTGEGFIDWEGILLNDRHETYPRTIGKLHFETPVGPGWANPVNGSFDDPRFEARDGRKFGPLPKSWSDFKGIYHNEDDIVISYTVGRSQVLEQLGREQAGDDEIFTRTLDITASNSLLQLRVAPVGTNVELIGTGASLNEVDGYVMMNVERNSSALVKLLIANQSLVGLTEYAKTSSDPKDLTPFTQTGGDAHYPEIVTSTITKGIDDGLFAIDQMTPPFDNPWDARMKLSGIDFMKDPNVGVVCTTDGDVFRVTGLLDESGVLKWQRIAAGMFQPLGIKVLDEQIFVICRDQLVRLRDFNGDFETDFYESFNHDHQVTDHFHEFAMGLQADEEGNLYYAKSGRHAREALIPQHGTLLKVSKDGSKTEILATGFRAANGILRNPDGSFVVTDQQGYWNPMNRINWVEPSTQPKFYGNMWGYEPPEDFSREAMEQPMVWVDMEFDRSPSELLWVDSEKWGPLNGSLLSFSYGYGKIQLVLHEEVNGQRQGGVIDLPGVKFLTGVMRGRFNDADGHLYACGMSAWGTSQSMHGGGLYRVRYTRKTLTTPVELQAFETGLKLTFAEELDASTAEDLKMFEVRTWDLIRSEEYGSDRYNEKALEILDAQLQSDGKTIVLSVKDIAPVDVMTISYDLKSQSGDPISGRVQNTIHNLGSNPSI